MTFSPAPLRALQAYWSSQGGVNLGVVGDIPHQQRGVSYHLGRDHLVSTAYSIKTARDKRGLSFAASAIDLGKLDGSYDNLRSFSGWLVRQCQAHKPWTSDIREVIYTLDGRTVLRYDRERGYGSNPRPGEADTSHLWHTHISFYRDSEFRDKTNIFRPYFGSVPIPLPDTGTAPEPPMSIIAHKPKAEPIVSGVFRSHRTGTSDIVTYPYDGDPRRGSLSRGAVRHALGVYLLTGVTPHREVVLIWEDGEFAFVALADGEFTPYSAAPPDAREFDVMVGGSLIGKFKPPTT